MKISTLLVDVKDQLLIFIAEGFSILGNAFTWIHDTNAIARNEQEWRNKVYSYLSDTFPTTKEAGQFMHTTSHELIFTSDERANSAINGMNIRLKVLENILDSLEKYYQFEPETLRLYIQGIDSFSKVRGLNAAQVKALLKNGFLDRPEEQVKTALLEIIGQSYKPNDWGGETEDIYSSYIWLNGERVQTSIILKGGGTIHGHETHLGDLGKNGDQLERMMRTSSSKLFIIQSVKPIGQDIVSASQAFVSQHWAKGNRCYFCIIDGQDTAMLLYAYNLINEPAKEL